MIVSLERLFVSLVICCAATSSVAEPATAAEPLRDRAEARHQSATRLITEMHGDTVSDEELRELGKRARRELDEAITLLESALDENGDGEKWAEKLLEDCFGQSFWLDRFTVIEDFDYYGTLAAKREGKRFFNDADQGPTGSDTSEYQSDDLASDGNEADEEDAPALQTSCRGLEDLGGSHTTAEALSFLKGELRSSDPHARALAAADLGAMRTGDAVRPLVRQLRKEEDADVRDAILEALSRTARRPTGRALGSIASCRDETLKLDVLRVLESGVGGRHGAMAALEFVVDSSPDVRSRAIDALERIGGMAGAEALGKASVKRKLSSMQIERCFQALEQIGSPTAARALLASCTNRGEHSDAAEDALVRIGSPSIEPAIEALSKGKLRKQAHEVLRRITGKSIGMNAGKWEAWRSGWESDSSSIDLPRYRRGQEPWLGGAGRGF